MTRQPVVGSGVQRSAYPEVRTTVHHTVGDRPQTSGGKCWVPHQQMHRPPCHPDRLRRDVRGQGSTAWAARTTGVETRLGIARQTLETIRSPSLKSTGRSRIRPVSGSARDPSSPCCTSADPKGVDSGATGSSKIRRSTSCGNYGQWVQQADRLCVCWAQDLGAAPNMAVALSTIAVQSHAVKRGSTACAVGARVGHAPLAVPACSGAG